MTAIECSVDSDGIGLLVLNRPEALNALNRDLLEEARAALAAWADDSAVRALLITGRGRAFCAGADLKSLDRMDASVSPGESVARAMQARFNPLMVELYNFPKPVVVAVNGIAAGGGVGLALCADLVLASEQAAFKVVQVQQLGIAADLGANWLLQRAVGRSRAMAMCLLGATVPADQLLAFGAVAEVLAPDELLPRATECALALAAVPADAILATRRLVDEAPARSFEESLEDERGIQRELCDAPHFMAMVRAFAG